MGKIKDLTGQRFGKLTVLEITSERRNRQVVWKCQCDCGNIVYVVGQSLRSLHTTSCGCLCHQEKAENLQGQHFGKLLVLERDYSRNTKNRISFWKCQCDCGNIRIVSSTELRKGIITQCHNCAIINRKKIKVSHKGPIKNITNKRFGKLIALSPLDKRDNAGHVIWKCKCDCGNFCEVPSNRLVTYNTVSCGCLTTSIGEEIIKNILQENNINFKREYSFNDCISLKSFPLFFDFAVFNKNNQLAYLIEYDGKQHFEPIQYFGGKEQFIYNQQCDKIKNEYCQKNNIILIRIPYNKKIKKEDVIKNDYL